MATNILPSGIGDLFQLAGRVEKGLEKYAAWLFKDPEQAGEFSALLKFTRAAEKTFLLARAEKATAGKRFAEADAALTVWLAKARLVVMLAYGNKWSESWIAAGFTHRGTNVPKRIGPRIELSRSLAQFFADHPEYEVPFAAVTAEEAGRLQKAIATAEDAVRLAKQDVTKKKRVRDAAEKKLRHEMHFVVAYLHCVIEKTDPRWLAFGLNCPRPGDPPVDPRKFVVPSAEVVAIDFSGEATSALDEMSVA